MLLIGSRAMVFRAPALLQRPPQDFDFIGYKDEINSWLDQNKIKEEREELPGKVIVRSNPPCEFEDAGVRKSAEMLVELVKTDKHTINTPFGMVPNFDLLFTLKTSHRYLKDSPFFWKTAIDYHRMKELGAKIRPEYNEFLKEREKETYVNRHPKLNVDKKEFFSEAHGVNYVWDHDAVHQSVALGERPAYTYYAKDGEEVKSDKTKFFALPEEVRLNGVIEEACVLAIERSLVPFPNGMTPKQAWLFALSKVASSITSGWFRAYAYENLFKVVKMYPEKYFEKFQNKVSLGEVKKHGE